MHNLAEESLQKKKDRKSLFVIMAQKLKTAFQTGTFSKSKSGTIAQENKKTITAVTQLLKSVKTSDINV